MPGRISHLQWLCISRMTYNIEFGNKTYRNSIVIYTYNYFEIEPMGAPNSLIILFPLWRAAITSGTCTFQYYYVPSRRSDIIIPITRTKGIGVWHSFNGFSLKYKSRH